MVPLLDSLIENKQKVKIFFGEETSYVIATITHYYKPFGVIKIDKYNLVLPLEMIAKIEPLDYVNGYTSSYLQEQPPSRKFYVGYFESSKRNIP